MADPIESQLKQLEAQLGDVSDALTAYRRLAAEFSATGTAKAPRQLGPKAVADGDKKKLERPSKEDVDSAWEKFSTASQSLIGELSALGTGSSPESSSRPTGTDSPDLKASFSSFIQSVGTSLSRAQDSLDSQARESFRASAAADGPLLPTLYRIPKLSAEVKFAFEKTKDRGLDLLFFSKKEQASEEHQQSIAFEIVATPPPPELLERLQRGIPSLQLVLAPSVREEVVEAIQRFRDLRAKLEDVKPKKLEQLELAHLPGPQGSDNHADRLLIIEVPASNARKFLLFAAGDSSDADSEHEVGAWHVDLTDPKDPKLKAVLRFSSEGDTGENQGFLKEFVLALGKRQAQFLAGLRPA
jgi:hypothetical protein